MLLTNATLVNWTPRQILPDHALLIREGRIAEIGKAADLETRYPDQVRRDAGGKLVLPANICAHTHFYGAFARGLAIPNDAPRNFPEILKKLWWNLDRALTLEDVRLSALVSLVDAVKHGTTLLIDHHASPNAIDGSLSVIAQAAEQAGVRAVLCYEVTDRNGEAQAQAGIAENLRFLREVDDHPSIRGAFGLHASLTLSDETLAACVRALEAFETGFHIHVAEHEADEDDSLKRSGVRVVRRLKRAGILGRRTIAAHAVHVDAWEMELLRQSETWVTHQPRSNMKNGVGAMRFDDMLRGGVKVCLGNDGMGNAMFDEWRAAYLLHKVINRDPRAADAESIVRVAVDHNAALAEVFFPDETFGTLSVGAAADLMVVDYHPFTPLTEENLPWHAIFGFESSAITATIAAGNVLMWDRQLLTLDEAAIAAEARTRASEVWARFRALATH
ncbi:MAG: putative aminohydrolase SsnA [Aggregatilineales bacterium]